MPALLAILLAVLLWTNSAIGAACSNDIFHNYTFPFPPEYESKAFNYTPSYHALGTIEMSNSFSLHNSIFRYPNLTGPLAGVFLDSIRHADVNNDGIPETIVLLRSVEHESVPFDLFFYVFDCSHDSPRLLFCASFPAGRSFRASRGRMTLKAPYWQGDDLPARPSLEATVLITPKGESYQIAVKAIRKLK